MKNCLSFLLMLSFYLGFSQNVFIEDFNDNNRHWDLINEYGNTSSISEGYLNWKRNALKSDVITQYLNRLNELKDWSVTISFEVKKIGTEYGVFWGGRDKSNANYFCVRGNKTRTFKAKGGKVITSTEYAMSLNVKLDKNEVTVQRRGTEIQYFVNGKKVKSEPYRGLEGKKFGVILFGNSSISINSMKVSGDALPINEIEGLYYNESPQKLSEAINTKYDETNPIISADGQRLYFSRNQYPENIGGPMDIEDAYESIKSKTGWAKAKNMGKPINNHGPNAVHAVTPDGNTLLLMNLYEPDGKQKGQGISVSNKSASGWSIPEQFKIRQYYNKSGFNEFFLSNNGKVLFLAIQREDTRGGRDLYVSFNGGRGVWSEPKNMGATINTKGTELSPFLASDGVTMYFSSNGHPGYGQNDIFMTKRLDDTWLNWSKPKNLGKPINGLGKDSYYSVPAKGDYAYFVTTDKALKTTDIYKVKLPSKVKPNPVVIIKGKVLNKKTKAPIGTVITYRDLGSNEEVGIAHSDPKTGKYEIVLPLEKAYAFFAEKNGFYSVRDNIDLKDVKSYDVITRDLYLVPIEVATDPVVMNNVLFKQGTPFLLASSFPELDRLAQTMKENSTMEIELLGHTDNIGKEEELVKLSEDRVTAVRNYLVQKKGVSPLRIKGKGYGGSIPKYDNSRVQTRKLNRRVEFKIVKS